MAEIKEKILRGLNSGEFFAVIYQEQLNSRADDSALLLALSELHNDGHIDLVSQFAGLSRDDDKYDFFLMRRIFERVLPSIDCPTIPVINCVVHLTLESGNDLSANWTITPFIEFCQKDNQRVEEAINHVLDNIDPKIDMLTPAMIAGSRIDIENYARRAISLIGNESQIVSQRAIYALGRMNFEHCNDVRLNAFNSILGAVSETSSETILSAALKSLFSLSNHDNGMQERFIGFLKFLKNIKTESNDLIIHSASEILFLEHEKISTGMERELLDLASLVNPENNITLQNIDYALERIINRGDLDDAVAVLERMAERYGAEMHINSLNGVVRALVENKEALSFVMTRWLKSKRIIYGRLCHDLLMNTDEHGVEVCFDGKQLDGSSGDLNVFLAKKACGWLFTRPLSAISLIVSLVSQADEGEISELSDVAFNPLLISYPGSVRAFLDAQVTNACEKTRAFSALLLDRLNVYHEWLRESLEVKELRPPEEHRFTYMRYYQANMNEAMKKAQANSIISILGIKSSVLLYGTKSINYINHGGERSRREIPLQTMSHSIEFPSLHNIDALGLEHQLRFFRLEGCSS